MGLVPAAKSAAASSIGRLGQDSRAISFGIGMRLTW